MPLKIKTLFSKKNIKKLLRSTLCLLLCVLTVVFFGGVLAPTQAHAVAGIDDVIVFIIGIMVACGVTFTSADVAQNTARRYYNSVDSDTKSIIDKAKEQYDAKKEYYTVTTNGLIMCLASEWQKIFDSIASFIFNPSVIADSSYVDFSVPQATFKNYDSFVSLLQQNGSLDFDYQVTRDSYTAFTIGSTMIEFVGQDRTGKFPDEVISAFSSNSHNVIMKVSILGTQYSFYSLISSQPHMLNYIKYYDYQYQFNLKDSVINFGSRINSNSGYSYRSLIAGLDFSEPHTLMYYGSELLNVTSIEGHRYTITGSFGNIVCDDGTIFGSDYLMPCDSDKVTDENLTKAFTCDPSISIGNDYIGTDTTWTDSVADAGSGSIAFPLDVDDLIDLSPSDVRDKTLTDTGDIATDKDKTDTKDDTKDDTKEDPDTKPNKPSIPGLSLPEILFKEKFPFCLPWDLYNLFAGLQTEEEAPRFVVPFKFERLGIDEEIVIDFSDYEEQIKIIRFFTGAMFVLALIMISRKLIGAQ